MDPRDIYNMDETGFRVGVGKSQWVITEEWNKPLYQTDADNRDYITSVECISGSGYTLPPMLILAGKQHLANWQQDSLDPDTFWGVSDTGYTNDDLCEEWIKHFDRFTVNRRIGKWRMLIFDGYGSHLTREVLSFMEDKHIWPFCLLPHSSHLCQPLDVGVFQPFKHWHTEAIDEAMRQAGGEYSRVDFLANFQAIRERTFRPTTVVSAWMKSGLIPFDPTIVLNHLLEYRRRASPERAITPEDNIVPDIDEWPTPYTHRQVTQYGKELMDQMDLHDSHIVERYIRGAEAKMLSGSLAEQELTKLHEAAVARAARKAQPNTLVQRGGTIYSHQARAKVTIRQETEREKAERALNWATTKEDRAHSALRNKKIKVFKATATKARIWLKQSQKRGHVVDFPTILYECKWGDI